VSSNLMSLAYRLDPVQMARGAGLELDPWQSDLVRSQAQRILVNCSRQTGKSTTTAVLADHTAFYQDNSTILLLSPSLRQSGELFNKCLSVYRSLDRPIPADAENKLSLELENGSRIVSLPGKEGTVRGFSAVDLLIIDEASRVPDELYMAVAPMLAVSGGRLILLSTPFGTRGFYWEAYKNREQWEYYEVPATECKRIPSEFLEEQRESMGEWFFMQEFMCKFMDSQSSAFRSEDIEQIVRHDLSVWDI
jgi:hypothetical protein